MNRADAIDLVHGLVAIPSVSRSEAEASRWLVAQMTKAGYDRAFVDEAGNAVGELGPASGAARTIVLLGHIDTVPGNIPVRIVTTDQGDVLYGRGSVDAKGPLAAFVAGAARAGSAWAHRTSTRVVVVGAVEEEAATSKGARFVASRFDGVGEPVPDACIIGEPSGWHRVTLGYKGRLLLDLEARQPMAHTAGPDASVAMVVVDIWNHVSRQAAAFNAGREKAFEQLTPSLRRFITSTDEQMQDSVDAQIAWRLPLDFDAERLAGELAAWTASHVGATATEADAAALLRGAPMEIVGARTEVAFRFRGWERAWRSDRQNALVRAFLGAIRSSDAPAAPGFVVKTGTSDMNVVAPLWQCPIVAYGPGDSTLDHTPHEHLLLAEYWRAVCVIERVLQALALSRAS